MGKILYNHYENNSPALLIAIETLTNGVQYFCGGPKLFVEKVGFNSLFVGKCEERNIPDGDRVFFNHYECFTKQEHKKPIIRRLSQAVKNRNGRQSFAEFSDALKFRSHFFSSQFTCRLRWYN